MIMHHVSRSLNAWSGFVKKLKRILQTLVLGAPLLS